MSNSWPDSRYPPSYSNPNPSHLHSSHPLPHIQISSYSHSLYPNPSYLASAPSTENFKPSQYSSNPNNYPAAVNPFVPHGGYAAAGPTSTTNLPQHIPAAARHVSGGYGEFHYENRGTGGSGGSYLNHTNKNEFALKEAIRQYGADPTHLPNSSSHWHGYQIPAEPFHAQTQLALPRSNPPQSGVRKTAPKKSSSTATSYHCDVCSIDCNSIQVFITHKQGKKHKTNLESLKDSITLKPKTDASPIGTDKNKTNDKKDLKTEAMVIGSVKEKGEASVPGSSKKKRRNNNAPVEDLETKRRKVLEAGAEPSGVRVCEICNAVTNSQKVFESHIAGLRHAENLKKLQAVLSAL